MTQDLLTRFDAVEAQKVITEEAFGKLLEPFAGPFLSIARAGVDEKHPQAQTLRHMGFLANVIKRSSDVEHLLDRYRARNNRNWIYFRELTATIKNFGKASFLLEELTKNPRTERLFPNEEHTFNEKAEQVKNLFTEILHRSFEELAMEQARLTLRVPDEIHRSSYKLKMPGEIILPHTIEESGGSDMILTVKKIANRFMELSEKVRWVEEVSRAQGPDLAPLIPEKISERGLRKTGAHVHNLLSWYDTYIFSHRIEGEYPLLKGLREIFLAQVNLFKIATILTHYYERHLYVASPISHRLEEIIPASRLLEAVFHFVLHYLLELFHIGARVAQSLLDVLVEIVIYELPVPKDLGFHARPSTRVAKVVKHYGADVKMLVDDQVFDAGSILWMLSAGGYIMTKGLDTVRFRGDRRALEDLKLLAEYNYGESVDGKDVPLPEELSYLN